jgi:PPIC-type PPIASE domain
MPSCRGAAPNLAPLVNSVGTTPPARRALLAVALAALGLLAACGDDEPEAAAVVDGTEISQQDVVDELEAIAGNGDYLEALESRGVDVLGEGEGNFTTAFASQVLARQIQYTIVTNEVARRGLEVDDECRAAARDEVVRGLSDFSQTGDGQTVFDNFPENYREKLITWNSGVLILQGDLAGRPCIDEAALEDYFDEHAAEFTEVCAHHILVPTVEEANTVVADLAAGADFATIATERSTDTGSGAQGGDLGCAPAGGYVPEFRDAVVGQEIGVVGAPVESEFGFHVIRVDSREEPILDDVRGEVVTAVAQEVQGGFGEWFEGALTEADVTVDERYGTWDAATAGITRPQSEGDAPTTGATPSTTVPTDSGG